MLFIQINMKHILLINLVLLCNILTAQEGGWKIYKISEKYGAYFRSPDLTNLYPEYDELNIVTGGMLLATKNGLSVLIDSAGNTKRIDKFSLIQCLGENCNMYAGKIRNSEKWQLVFGDLEVKIQDEFDSLSVSDGDVIFWKMNKRGAYNCSSDTCFYVAPIFDSIYLFEEYFIGLINNEWNYCRGNDIKIHSGFHTAENLYHGILLSDTINKLSRYFDYQSNTGFKVPFGYSVESSTSRLVKVRAQNDEYFILNANGDILKTGNFNIDSKPANGISSRLHFVYSEKTRYVYDDKLNYLYSVNSGSEYLSNLNIFVLNNGKGSLEIFPVNGLQRIKIKGLEYEHEYNSNLLIVRSAKEVSLFDSTMKMIFHGNYAAYDIAFASDGIILLRTKTGFFDCFDTKSRVILGRFSGELMSDYDFFINSFKDEQGMLKHNILDNKLKRIHSEPCNEYKILNENLVLIKQNGNHLLVDLKGNTIHSNSITEVYCSYSEGLIYRNDSGLLFYNINASKLSSVDEVKSYPESDISAYSVNGKWYIMAGGFYDEVDSFLVESNESFTDLTLIKGDYVLMQRKGSDGFWNILNNNNYRPDNFEVFFLERDGSVTIDGKDLQEHILPLRNQPQPVPSELIDENGNVVVDENGNVLYLYWCMPIIVQPTLKPPLDLYFNGKSLLTGLDDIRLPYVFNKINTWRGKSVYYISSSRPEDIQSIGLVRSDIIIPLPIMIMKNNKWGLVDWNGKVIIPCDFEEIQYYWFNNSAHYLCRSGSSADIYNAYGKHLDKIAGDIFIPLYDVNNNPVGVHVNIGGQIKQSVVQFDFEDYCDTLQVDTLRDYASGGFHGLYYGPGTGFPGATWNEVFYWSDPLLSNANYSIKPYYDEIVVEIKGKQGVIDLNGYKVILPVENDSVRIINFSEGRKLFQVWNNGICSLIDQNNNLIFKGNITRAGFFDSDNKTYLVFRCSDKSYGFEYVNGNFNSAVVSDTIFQYKLYVGVTRGNISFHLADCISYNDDVTGDYKFQLNPSTISELVYYSESMEKGAALFYQFNGPWVVSENNNEKLKYGLINDTGELILSIDHDEIYPMNAEVFAVRDGENLKYYNIRLKKFVTDINED
jgi:hypothetical protein